MSSVDTYRGSREAEVKKSPSRSSLIRRRIAAVAFSVGIGTAIGAGVLGGVGWLLDSGDQSALDAHAHDIEDARGKLEEIQHNVAQEEQAAGEACISNFRFYMPGGTLEGTDENTIVADLMNGHQCGDSPTKIRAGYRSYKLDTASVAPANDALTHLVDFNPGFISDVQDSETKAGLIAGGVIGGLIIGGFIYSLDIYDDIESHYNRT